jgi:hypothetical protein
MEIRWVVSELKLVAGYGVSILLAFYATDANNH